MLRKQNRDPELTRKQDLVRNIGIALKKGLPIACHASMICEQKSFQDIDTYFFRLRQLLKQKEYLELVGRYIRKNQLAIKFSKNKRNPEVQIPLLVPLTPSHLSFAGIAIGMPYLWELQEKPGRSKSEIDDAIIDILGHNAKMSVRAVCKELDKRNTPLPDTKLWKDEETWTSSYQVLLLRQRIHVRVSKIRRV